MTDRHYELVAEMGEREFAASVLILGGRVPTTTTVGAWSLAAGEATTDVVDEAVVSAEDNLIAIDAATAAPFVDYVLLYLDLRVRRPYLCLSCLYVM